MDDKYFTSYISAACNGTPHAVAWGLNNLIAYGSCNAVNLYDPRQCFVTRSLAHHTGRVNSVRWIKFNFEPEQEIISSSSDKSAALWKQNSCGEFEVTAELTGHRDVVTYADAIYPSFVEWENDRRTLLAATASADSTVMLWKRNKGEKVCGKAGVISLKTGLCLTLRLFILGGQSPLLAIAADDSSIHLYSLLFKDVCEIVYNKVFTLTAHEDWVRSMDFITVAGNNLLASASQDTTIRLWRFNRPEDINSDKLISTEGKTFTAETVNGGHVTWCVYLESVLSGHEGWVYGVHWRSEDPFLSTINGFNPLHLRLLSSSLDKSMTLWAPSESGVWLEEVRVGEVGGNTLGFYGCQISPDGESILAHGYNGSFHLWHKALDGGLWNPGVTVGGHFGEVTDLGWDPKGEFVLSLSADQTTRLHAPWVQKEQVIRQEVTFEVWDRTGMNKRHFTKLVWTPAGKQRPDELKCSKGRKTEGSFNIQMPENADPKEPLMAELSDFGVRKLLFLRNLLNPVKCEVVKAWKTPVAGVQAGFRVRLEFPAPVQWHEVARPQVHGYNLQCLAILSRYRFASGAEEKVIRAFQAPANFVDNFCRLCRIEDEEARKETKNTPRGASVPSLGLSNKAVYQNDNTVGAYDAESADDQVPFRAVSLEEPPTEEHLVQNTLWPEVQKLYGHGYELYSLAASHNGRRLASACRATSQQHAAIILWDTKSWVQIQTLTSHQLTVTQMAFSPDDRHLLAVSRDRRWSLFETTHCDDQPSQEYNLVASTNKTNGLHTRVIWCCSWTHDSKYFATGSREGRIVVWGADNSESEEESTLGRWRPNKPTLELQGDCVNCVAFASRFVGKEERYLLAVGLDAGCIQLYWWQPTGDDNSWIHIISLGKNEAHHLGVKRLVFRPVPGAAGCPMDSSIIQLASCGEDHAVKVHSFNLEKFSAVSVEKSCSS